MTKDEALINVSMDETAYPLLPISLQKDRDVILEAVEKVPKYVYEHLKLYKDDEEIVKKAIASGIGAVFVGYISDRLKGDMDLAYYCLKHIPEGGYLGYLSKEIQEDKTFVMEYLKTGASLLGPDAEGLACVSEKLQDDEDVVMLAMNLITDFSVSYASDRLKADKAFISKCLTKNGWAYRNASNEVKADRELAKRAIGLHAFSLRFSPYTDDKEIVEIAIKENPSVIMYVSERLKRDKDIAEKVLRRKGVCLDYLPEWSNDSYMARIAYKQNITALLFLGDELKNDRAFMLELYNYNTKAFHFVGDVLLKDLPFLLRLGKIGTWDVKKYRKNL